MVRRKRRPLAKMRAEPRVDWRLYEFTIEVAMAVRRGGPPSTARADRPPECEIWRDAGYGSRMAAADSVQ